MNQSSREDLCIKTSKKKIYNFHHLFSIKHQPTVDPLLLFLSFYASRNHSLLVFSMLVQTCRVYVACGKEQASSLNVLFLEPSFATQVSITEKEIIIRIHFWKQHIDCTLQPRFRKPFNSVRSNLILFCHKHTFSVMQTQSYINIYRCSTKRQT